MCHTHLAEYVNVGLGFGLALALGGVGEVRQGRLGSRALAIYVVGVLVLSITTSHSRGGFLAMLAASLFTLICLGLRRFRLWIGLAAALAMSALFLLVLGDASPYLARLGTILDAGEGAYQFRAELWRTALRGWVKHPIWGTGLGTFAAAAPPFTMHDHGVYILHAENEYVEMLLEGGCAGFGLALLGLIGVGLKARRAWQSAPLDAERALVLGAAPASSPWQSSS